MEEYVQYREVDENIPIKCPIHDNYNFPPNYRTGAPILSTQNYRNVYNYPQYYYDSTQNIHQPNLNEGLNQYPYVDPYANLSQFQSSDGVLRGYTNNYSFYISGSAKTKPAYTNNYNTNSQNININNYYQNLQSQKQNLCPNPQSQRIIDMNNYQYNQVNQPYHIIKNNFSQQNLHTTNYNNNLNTEYYYNKPLVPPKCPIIQRRIVKRVVEKEPLYKKELIGKKQNINTYNYNNANEYKISNQNNQVNNNIKVKYVNKYPYTKNQKKVYTSHTEYDSYNQQHYMTRNNGNNIYPGKNIPVKTEINLQKAFENEYEKKGEDEDDIYEVPERNNDNDYYIPKSKERPYVPVKKYSKSQRRVPKYTVHTQNLEMNRYLNDEEGDFCIKKNYKNIKRDYSSNDMRLQNKEDFIFENNDTDNQVRIKSSGSKNHKIYISNGSSSKKGRYYKTYTQRQEDYRPIRYNLEDYDNVEKDENYNVYQNGRNFVRKNNYQIVKGQNIKYMNKNEEYNYKNNTERKHINNDEEELENDDTEQYAYDSKKLTPSKEGNFGIVIKKKNIQRKMLANDERENNLEDFEGENIDSKEIRRMKNKKNIETEINEKYYDKKGNYLGERKIITTGQVPSDDEQREAPNKLMGEEHNYFVEQEENEEEYENEDDISIKNSTLDQNIVTFKKRSQNKIIPNDPKKSKYTSYYGGSDTNNVYLEIKGNSSKPKNEDVNQQNENVQLTKTGTYGIKTDNLFIPSHEHNGSEEGDSNHDEKEADEQNIEENPENFEEEEIGNDIQKEGESKFNEDNKEEKDNNINGNENEEEKEAEEVEEYENQNEGEEEMFDVENYNNGNEDKNQEFEEEGEEGEEVEGEFKDGENDNGNLNEEEENGEEN